MKIALYTANISEYDEISEYMFFDENIDYFLFTDNEDKKSKNWKVINVQKEGYEPKMVSRMLKTIIPKQLKKYDLVIWIDACFKQTNSLMPLLEMEFNDILVMRHNTRNCLYEEAVVCEEWKLEQKSKIYAQMDWYMFEEFPLDYGLAATGILIRRNNNTVKNFCKLWNKEVTTKCHRDQLSFNYAAWKTNTNVDYFEWDDKEIYFEHKKHIKERT